MPALPQADLNQRVPVPSEKRFLVNLISFVVAIVLVKFSSTGIHDALMKYMLNEARAVKIAPSRLGRAG